MTSTEQAMSPEDLTRLFVERANAGDAAGLAALYAEDAVMAFPPGRTTVGRAAIEALWKELLSQEPHVELETPLPSSWPSWPPWTGRATSAGSEPCSPPPPAPDGWSTLLTCRGGHRWAVVVGRVGAQWQYAWFAGPAGADADQLQLVTHDRAVRGRHSP